MIPRPSLAVIIPTIGRLSLARTLESVIPQLGERDEVIVVGDGPQPLAAALVASCRTNRGRWVYEATAPTHHWGAEQRMLAISLARADRLCFIDDDDRFAAGALARFRLGPVPALYQMAYSDGRILWATRGALQVGNVGTPMFCCARTPVAASWGTTYTGDFAFIRDTIAGLVAPVAWIPEVVALIGGGW